MEKAIIGRHEEIRRLKNYIASEHSEFIAVYGRRRVGKTFLIKELFDDSFTFRLTGMENARMSSELMNFSYAMKDYFGIDTLPRDWIEAFRMLSKAIERLSEGPKIIFIDELPWLDTPKSKFLGALEYFWNSWAYYRRDIKLIVCGSATTWMLNKIINARGGLHNRTTHQLLLLPFTLRETELYFQQRGFEYSRPEIISCYMSMGGVPYYLSLFENNKSVAENINALCFDRKGELVHEFDRLYKSIFKRSENHLAVISALSNVGKGMTRYDIAATAKLTNNGTLSTILNELEACDFIRSYVPFGKKKKDKLYQIIDQFTLFFFHFMRDISRVDEKDYWMKHISTSAYQAWSGYAFEIVCLHHINQIVEGLGISGTIYSPCSWTYRPTDAVRSDAIADEDLKTGAQIDLLIDRNDKTITVCEMKYSDNLYTIDINYNERVQARLRTFRSVTKTKKSLAVAYITPQGLTNNMYARRAIKQITAEQLFK